MGDGGKQEKVLYQVLVGQTWRVSPRVQLIQNKKLGVPPCRGARPCASTWGRPSFRSRPSASGCHGPIPFVNTQQRRVFTKGGSGQHRAPARPPVPPNARALSSIRKFYFWPALFLITFSTIFGRTFTAPSYHEIPSTYFEKSHFSQKITLYYLSNHCNPDIIKYILFFQ